MKALLMLAIGLGAAGIVPAVAVARRSPVVIFLAPLIGAGMAAVAAGIELGAGGSITADYMAVVVIVNLVVIAWWLAARRTAQRTAQRTAERTAQPPAISTQAPRVSWAWASLTVVVVLGCLAVPLMALRAPMIGWDANSIWLTHAFMVYGGHHELLTGLQNVAYQFSNPDYPPLVPAVGALAFKVFGLGNLHLAAVMTILLSACALGVVGTGIATAGSHGRQPTRIAAVVAAGAICIAGFAVSGISEVEGYTDLLWAAAAAGAVIWGLVLPRSPQALGVAWISAAVASLTKNEGLTTALIILVLIAFRYRPVSRREPMVRSWAERAGFVVLPALPGLAWAGLIDHIGVHDAFFKPAPAGAFKSASVETPLSRAGATIAAIGPHLAVAPVALAVLLAGCWFLRRDREHARLGNPAWLWIACLGSLAALLATYVIGDLEIHTWLATSVTRTTIFAQVVLYADIAIWMVIAADGAFARTDRQSSQRASSAGEQVPEAPEGPREPLSQR